MNTDNANCELRHPSDHVFGNGRLIGFQQVSELMHVAGVFFVGPIPAELQPEFSFAGAITSNAKQPEAADALLRFLSSAEAEATIVKASLAPAAAR